MRLVQISYVVGGHTSIPITSEILAIALKDKWSTETNWFASFCFPEFPSGCSRILPNRQMSNCVSKLWNRNDSKIAEPPILVPPLSFRFTTIFHYRVVPKSSIHFAFTTSCSVQNCAPHNKSTTISKNDIVRW